MKEEAEVGNGEAKEGNVRLGPGIPAAKGTASSGGVKEVKQCRSIVSRGKLNLLVPLPLQTPSPLVW